MNIFKPINIFITGASSGIGNALAHEYAKRYSRNNVPASRIDIGLQGIDSKLANVNIGLVSRRSEHLQKVSRKRRLDWNWLYTKNLSAAIPAQAGIQTIITLANMANEHSSRQLTCHSEQSEESRC